MKQELLEDSVELLEDIKDLLQQVLEEIRRPRLAAEFEAEARHQTHLALTAGREEKP